MSCRHDKDSFGFKTDPTCSSYRSPKERLGFVEKYLGELCGQNGIQTAPDNSKYEILEVIALGEYLVMKVKYENCEKCVGEAEKVMVFRATILEALKWRIIDPHFRGPRNLEMLSPPTVAPSPLARFMPDEKGWEEAKDYALRLGRNTR